MIMHQKKVRLEKNITTRKKPDLGLVIYLTADKLAQYILVTDKSR